MEPVGTQTAGLPRDVTDPIDSDIELVFGITRPVGTSSVAAVEQLQNSLTNYGYEAHVVKISDLLESGMLVENRWTEPRHAVERYYFLIEEGNARCRAAGSESELARRAMIEIRRLRETAYKAARPTLSKVQEDAPENPDASEADRQAPPTLDDEPVRRLAFIVDSLKRPSEVTALRRVYDDHFILIGLQASEEVRKEELRSKLLTEGVSEAEATRLTEDVVQRDGHENPDLPDQGEDDGSGTPYGPQTNSDATAQSVSTEETPSGVPPAFGASADSGATTTRHGGRPSAQLGGGEPSDAFPHEDDAQGHETEGTPGSADTGAPESRSSSNYGQDTLGTLPMSDLFVNVEQRSHAKTLIDRGIQLLFADPQADGPTPHEYGMQLATTASTTSPELGRRVGAAIINDEGDLLAMGSNHHPLDRETPAYDAGALDVRATARATLEAVVNRLNETERRKFEDDPDRYVRDLFGGAWAESDLKAITEYQRAVHAEMNALMSVARQRASLENATIYVTSYPCHNCAKHLLAMGLRAVYLEPYAKGRAASMYGDATNAFQPFTGVAPSRFHTWFHEARSADRKDKSGMRIEWDRSQKFAAVPTVTRLISRSTIRIREEFTITPQASTSKG